MRRNIARALLAFILVGAAAAKPVGAQATHSNTLKELVLRAIGTHEAVQLADSRIRRAQADVKFVSVRSAAEASTSMVLLLLRR